ncbi:unnamed protein product [Ectocarpus sp. 6 AP-2014]
MIGASLQRASRGGILQPNDSSAKPIENAFVFALDQNVIQLTTSNMCSPLSLYCTAANHLDHSKIGHAKIGVGRCIIHFSSWTLEHTQINILQHWMYCITASQQSDEESFELVGDSFKTCTAACNLVYPGIHSACTDKTRTTVTSCTQKHNNRYMYNTRTITYTADASVRTSACNLRV